MEPSTKRSQDILLQALDLDSPAERRALLDRECAGDAALREDVEGLLKALDQPGADGFLEAPHSLVPNRTEDSDRKSGAVNPYDLPVVAGKLVSELADRYRIERKLDEGGMGEVFLAHDKRTRGRVVLKSPRAGMLLDDPGIRERFLREVRAMGRLDHPHIVKVQDVFDSHGRPFAVFQYLGGDTLASRDSVLLRDWLPQLAEALDYLHSCKLIHRDVKPANIFFDAYGTPFLGDFGLVKPLQDGLTDIQAMTRTGMLMGTPKYMSPEAIESGPIDGRADQYALAIIVYEQLTGRIPFDAQTPAHIMAAHLSSPPHQLSVIDSRYNDECSVVLDRALSKNPIERFESCRQFAAELTRALPASAPWFGRTGTSSSGGDTVPESGDIATLATPEDCRREWRRYWHLSALVLYVVLPLVLAASIEIDEWRADDFYAAISLTWLVPMQIALLAVPHCKRPDLRIRWHHHAVGALGVSTCGAGVVVAFWMLMQQELEFSGFAIVIFIILLAVRAVLGEFGIGIVVEGKPLRLTTESSWLRRVVRLLELGSTSVCATAWLYVATHEDTGWILPSNLRAQFAGMISGIVIFMLVVHEFIAWSVRANQR